MPCDKAYDFVWSVACGRAIPYLTLTAHYFTMKDFPFYSDSRKSRLSFTGELDTGKLTPGDMPQTVADIYLLLPSQHDYSNRKGNRC